MIRFFLPHFSLPRSLRPLVSACLAVALAAPFAAIQLAPAQSAPDPHASDGALLFRDKGCAYCHGMDLAGTKKAPSLADVRKDKAWTPEKMTDQILNGGQKMPPFRESLSDEEIAQLVAFLRAKKRPLVPAMPAGQDTPAAPK